jgi:protein SCO1/2
MAAGAVLAAIAVVSYPLLLGPARPGPAGAPTTTASPIQTRFSLVDHTGRPVTEKTYDGKWKLVFFGFTHCPDVCPTALNTVARVLAELGGSADGLVPLFVTVDPKRDTPTAMAAYVAAFDKRIVGLTGTEQQVAEAAKAFRVYYARTEEKTAPGGYTMNHSSILYLMAPDGRFVTHFGHGEKPAEIAKAVKKVIDE